MVALLGTERWGCWWVSSASLGGSLVHPRGCRVQIPWTPREGRIVTDFEVELQGHGCRNALIRELKRGEVAMAGSTTGSGFHSSSLVQREGRLSPSGFLGAEVSGFTSCRRLKVRKRVAKDEGGFSVGFTCFGEDGAHNVRFARARALESVETASAGENFTPSCLVRCLPLAFL